MQRELSVVLQVHGIVVVTLLVIEAAAGVNALLLQFLGQVVQTGAWYAANIVEVMAHRGLFTFAYLFQQFHNVSGVQLTGKVEVYLSDAFVRETNGTPYAVHFHCIGFQCDEAEVGL